MNSDQVVLKTHKFGVVSCRVDKTGDILTMSFHSPQMDEMYGEKLPKLWLIYNANAENKSVVYGVESLNQKFNIDLNEIHLQDEIDNEAVDLEAVSIDNFFVSVLVHDKSIKATLELHLADDCNTITLVTLSLRETHSEKVEVHLKQYSMTMGDQVLEGTLRLARIPE